MKKLIKGSRILHDYWPKYEELSSSDDQ